MSDVNLTPAELDDARSLLNAASADIMTRTGYLIGAVEGVAQRMLDDATGDQARQLRHLLALIAVVEEKPDRRTVLSARIARAEKHAVYFRGCAPDSAARFAERAVQLRAELAALDTPGGGSDD